MYLTTQSESIIVRYYTNMLLKSNNSLARRRGWFVVLIHFYQRMQKLLLFLKPLEVFLSQLRKNSKSSVTSSAAFQLLQLNIWFSSSFKLKSKEPTSTFSFCQLKQSRISSFQITLQVFWLIQASLDWLSLSLQWNTDTVRMEIEIVILSPPLTKLGWGR